MTHSADKPARPVDPLVSVIMPAFNEEAVLGTLRSMLSETLAACDVRYEIVFVNDGSSDGTGLVLDRLAAADPHVRVVHLSRNFGHQAAVQAGLEHARGDAIVLMDADLQDAPTAIAQFLVRWRAGDDVVYAIRVNRKEHPLKRLLFSSFYRVLDKVSSTKMPLDAGNFGLIDRRVLRAITGLGERDRYFAGLRSWVGFRQSGVVVERLARYDDRPRVSLGGLWRLAKTAVFSFSTFPIAVFACIGYGALGAFIALSAFCLGCKLFTDLAIPGWTSNMLTATFFGAINALGIGILGEYVVRIYDQVRGRPIYLVDRVNEATPSTGEQAHAGDEPYLQLLQDAQELLAAQSPSAVASDPVAGHWAPHGNLVQ